LNARQPLSWDEIFDLHVVRKVERLVSRRWNLGLGFADHLGREVRAPRLPHHASRQVICQVVQDCGPGAAACAGSAREVALRLREQAEQRPLRAAAMRIRCHAGLDEIAVPIVDNRAFHGLLLCGGFLGPDSDAREVDRRVRPLSLSLVDYAPARDYHPRLSDAEISYVGDLVEAAVEEIVACYRDRIRRQRGASDIEKEFTTRHAYDGLVGRARPMQDLYRLLDRVIASDSTVLIQGENGTGKELIARAIHYNSARRSRRFVVQNCSAFNDNLLDSELFGHKKGAFTGAISDKQGLFEVADKGTFFLDEIGDMSPALQVKVLRVLQEGTFTAVGDTEVKHVDVRIIAATNRDLRRMVASGEFREDLYYRINVINIISPPLRERRDDIALLIEHFLKRHTKGQRQRGKRLSDRCIERLTEYSWPGNVRELENEIERLVVLAGDEPVITDSLLSPRICAKPAVGTPAAPAGPHSLPEAVRALERRMIYEALSRNRWNKTRAAGELQISRRNLIRLVQKYDLETDRG
jgi:two-component system, NtrC family, response regulator HupR/HoxA